MAEDTYDREAEVKSHFVCQFCGEHVDVDEDECCVLCGNECVTEPCSCSKPEDT